MYSIYTFVLTRTSKNLALFRLKRLRNPRYLIASLIGAFFLYGYYIRNLVRGHNRLGQLMGPDWLQWSAVVAAGLSVVFLGFTAGIWILSGSSYGLLLTEAESSFMIPAPLSRRSLITYRLLRMQLPIVFGALISSFVLGGHPFQPEGARRAVAMYLLLGTGALHGMAAGLTRNELRRRNIPIVLVQVLAAGLLAALLAVIWNQVAASWRVSALVGFDDVSKVVLSNLEVLSRGPVRVILWPFQAMAAPFLAPSTATFLPLAGVAAGIFLAHLAWVMALNPPIEEESVARAKRYGERMGRRRGRGRAGAGGRRFHNFGWGLPLPAHASPEAAIVWKNITGGLRGGVLIGVVVGAVAILIGPHVSFLATNSGDAHTLVATILLGAVGFSMVLGPRMLPLDLRQDLASLSTLRTYPMTGTRMLVSQVAAPVLLLTLYQWTALAVLAGHAPWIGQSWLSLPERFAFVVAVGMIALPINLAGVLLENTSVLLWPAWVGSGSERPRGIEAVGQRIVGLLFTLGMLLLALLPGAGVAAAMILFLRPMIGAFSFLAAGMALALTLSGMTVVLLPLLSRVFDRLDPADEGLNT